MSVYNIASEMNYQASLLGVMIMAVSIHGMTLSQNVNASNAVISGVKDFGANFNAVVAKEKSGNYIFSPLSVGVALAMTSFGADGNTRVELQQSLRSPADETVMKNGYQAVIDSLNNVRGVELAVANKIFIANKFDVKDEFKEIIKTYFRSASESLDFEKNEESAGKINDWVATQTRDQIKELFKPEDLTGDTVMVLANAVYFKGKWAIPFNPTFTGPKTFHADETTTKNVDMMYRSGEYNWGEINNFNAKYVELPYENEDVSLFVFLPNGISALANLEENFNNIDWAELSGPKSKLGLSIPKFRIESQFDLKTTLKKLNIEDMFDLRANFSRINENPQIRVGKVIHKAVIDVNEEGSEMSSSTGVEVEATSLPPQLTIDKPFICVLRVNTLGVNLFYARIVDPTLSA